MEKVLVAAHTSFCFIWEFCSRRRTYGSVIIFQSRFKNGQEDIVTAKDRMHIYASGGAAFSVGDQLALKPNIMLRKVKGLPLSTELTAMVSWQNRFDVGVSARSNSSMALLSLVNFNGIQIGYAYETPTSNQLSGLGLKTHEVVLRFQFGEADNTSAACDAASEEE